MKRKIYITALLLFIMTLGYAAYSLITKKSDSSLAPAIAKEENALKPNLSVLDSLIPDGLKEDLVKINKAHAALDNIKITNHFTKVSTFFDDKQTVEENQFSLFRKGAKIFYDAGSIKRLQDERYNIMINQDMHMILLFDPDKSFGSYMKEALKNFNPDSSLLWADKAEQLTADKGNKAYAIYYSMMPYSRMDIDFDINTNLINHVIFYMDNFDEEDDDVKTVTITIDMKYQKLIANTKDLFDMRKYFTSSKDELKPSDLYAGYEIYNNMKK